MNIFGIHVCWVEIQAAIMAIPVIGFCWICMKNWLKGRRDDHPHKK